MHQKSARVYTFGPFRLDPTEQQLLRDGRLIPLTPKVLALLQVLVENAGHLVGRDELIRTVWPDTFVEEGNLSRCISVLRKALAGGAESDGYIETVPKSGYRFIADVTSSYVAEARLDLNRSVPASTAPASQPPTRDLLRGLRGQVRTALIACIGIAALSALAYTTWLLAAARPAPLGQSVVPNHWQVTFTGTDASPAISPDGKFIAYVSDDPPRRHVTVREVGGGQPVIIATSTAAGMLRWSPDGSQVMFFLRGPDRNGVYVAPRAGGTLQQIAPGPYRSCWSPDGRTIATVQPFVGRVRLLNQQTGASQILSLQGQHQWFWDIDWSPDSNRLLTVSQNRQGAFQMVTIQVDGRNQRTVVEDSREIPSARWSPRGNAIYYSRRVDQTTSIFKIRLSSTGDALAASASALLTGLESDGFFEISADGQRLTYAREPYFSNLWLVDISRGATDGLMETRQLTHGTSQVERPSVSPDGKSVLFTVGRESASNLYVLPITGGVPRQLTHLDAFTTGGVWSPDGSQVAFASDAGGARRIWIAKTNSPIVRPVSTGNVSDSFDLAWGIGSRLYYQQMLNRDYYVLNPDSGGGEPMLWQGERQMGWVFSPIVSPDGEKVAVFWNRPNGRGIWVMDLATGRKTMLLGSEKADAVPLGWSPDGQRLYLWGGEQFAYRGRTVKFGETTKDMRVLAVPATGGPVSTVAVLPFTEVGGISITPDGRRFVCAVYSSRSDVWIVDHFDPEVGRVAAK
jgi:Tol biopolymer transport system component/DNA-binding winged helix-turn-helix (wHTH) protein